MATLTKENYNDNISIVLSKACKISPDKESKVDGITKTINLEVDYNGLTFKDLMAKGLKSDVIAWQNGSNGRKAFDKHTDGMTIKIKATSPGSSYIDPEEQFMSMIENMSKEDALKKIEELKKLINK